MKRAGYGMEIGYDCVHVMCRVFMIDIVERVGCHACWRDFVDMIILK